MDIPHELCWVTLEFTKSPHLQPPQLTPVFHCQCIESLRKNSLSFQVPCKRTKLIQRWRDRIECCEQSFQLLLNKSWRLSASGNWAAVQNPWFLCNMNGVHRNLNMKILILKSFFSEINHAMNLQPLCLNNCCVYNNFNCSSVRVCASKTWKPSA